MFSNIRLPVILFIAGLMGFLLGAACKVLHWPGAQTIIGSMLMVQFIAIVWLVVLIIRLPEE